MSLGSSCNRGLSGSWLKSNSDHRFVRRGVVGSHKDELTADIIREFDLWSDINLKDHKLNMDDFANYSKFASV